MTPLFSLAPGSRGRRGKPVFGTAEIPSHTRSGARPSDVSTWPSQDGCFAFGLASRRSATRECVAHRGVGGASGPAPLPEPLPVPSNGRPTVANAQAARHAAASARALSCCTLDQLCATATSRLAQSRKALSNAAQAASPGAFLPAEPEPNESRQAPRIPTRAANARCSQNCNSASRQASRSRKCQ